MPSILRQAYVPYGAHKMYQLVNAVEYYSEFLPFCRDAKVVSSSESEIVATLWLDAGPIASSFTTRNLLQKDTQVIMVLEDGPFSHLHGEWNFTQLGEDGSKVEFELDFEFTHKLASIAFGRVFKRMTEKMFDAFLQRATEINQ